MLVVKVYDSSFTTLKETIKWSLLLWDITFTANKNGWQGNTTFEIAKEITNTDYSLWDIVKVMRYDEQTKDWRPLYMGYVTKLGRKQDTSRQYIQLHCIGMASLFTEREIAKNYNNKPAWQLIREIIVWIPGINFDTTTIPDWPITTNDWIVSWTIAEAITTIAESVGWNWYVDGKGTVYFFETPTSPTHYFTNKRDVESIEIQEDMQEMVNSVRVQNGDMTQEVSYQDPISIAQYGEKYQYVQSKIYGTNALNLYAENYVNARKDPKKETTIVINRKYPIETIKPWDTIKLRNFAYPFDNIQIEKIQYTQDKCIVYLDRYISFGLQIKSLVK